MNRKAVVTQIGKSPSNSGDKTCKKSSDRPAGAPRCAFPEVEKQANADRGDVKRGAGIAGRKADVGKRVLVDSKVQTVDRCSSISKVTADCVTIMPSRRLRGPNPRQEPAQRPTIVNTLCREKCRVNEESRKLRRRYTFRLKTTPVPKEKEKIGRAEEEDPREVANELKNYYLPNHHRPVSPPPRRASNEKSRTKTVTCTTERSPVRYAAMPAQAPAAKLSKMTSPVKLQSMQSKVSIKRRPKSKKKAPARRLSSPDLANSCMSPPTEIARWIPDAGNVHAKPYYEAWVSTTLAAISQCSPNNELYRQKKDIVQRLSRDTDQSTSCSQGQLNPSRCDLQERDEWEMPDSATDHSFVGKIRIKR